MIAEAILGVFVSIIAVGTIIGITKPEYLSTYTVAVGTLIALPIVLIIKLIKLVVWVVVFVWTLFLRLGLLFSKSLVKSLTTVAIGIVHGLITLITTPIKYIGAISYAAVKYLKRLNINSGTLSSIISARGMMIDIIVEIDDVEPELERKEEYRNRLTEVKESGKERLSFGEYTLSLTIGIILIFTQALSIQPFRTKIWGISPGLAIEVGLVLIAVSITYRVMIIEFLCFSGNEQFDSLNEMDVALSYQKGIANVGIVQYLSFMMYLGIYISEADIDLIKSILKRYYRDDNYIEAMRYAAEELDWK